MRRFLALCVLATLLVSSHAFAQTPALNSTSFQVERFEPMPGQGANILNVATSDVIPHGQPSVGVFFHYVDDPISLVRSDDESVVVERIIAAQFKTELWASIGLHDFADLGFAIPFIFYQDGGDLAVFDNPGSTVSGAEIGDARIVPKVRLINPDWAGGVGAAVVGTVFLPTGNPDNFNSDQTLKFEPRLVVDYQHDVGLQLSGNIAYLFRPKNFAQNYVIDDVVRWSFGAELPTGVENFNVIGSLFGDIPMEPNRRVDDFNTEERDGKGAPVEALGGLQFKLPMNLVANVGAGAGLSKGVGSPDFRVFGSFGYTPQVSDKDGDGIYDDEDDCPKQPEDPDGFEDNDGCPDRDNDEDGILDEADSCPDQAEDHDNFEDENGCPDPDNDGDTVLDTADECPDTPGLVEKAGCPELDKDHDGLLDAEDKCPDDPEDKDGFEDEDGCPDVDNDKDGILDDVDKCKNDAEDPDGFEDEDGCPDLDNDKDGVLDPDDKCPLEPETINGVDDEDGCPDKGKSKVRITKTKIEILERVYFDTGKASIKPRSFNLLNQVGQVMKANPQITKIRIEGHTDSRGKDDYNLKLSQDRADSVREYLLAQKIDAGRLVALGYGETKPIEDNKKKSGREKNRRVEFTIIEVDGKQVGEGPVVIEKKEIIEDGADAPKPDATKQDAPKDDAPKTDAPKPDATKEQPKTDAPKEEPKKTN